MFTFFAGTYQLLITIGKFLQPFLLLGFRLFWGLSFFLGGKAKLDGIDHIIEYFGTLGIPFHVFNAYAVALIELVGGFCLLIGFATRLAAVPLIVIMVVAYLTAHRDAVINIVADPNTFIQQSPFNYLITCLVLFAFGAGAFSIDAIIKRFVLKRGVNREVE